MDDYQSPMNDTTKNIFHGNTAPDNVRNCASFTFKIMRRWPASAIEKCHRKQIRLLHIAFASFSTGGGGKGENGAG